MKDYIDSKYYRGGVKLTGVVLQKKRVCRIDGSFNLISGGVAAVAPQIADAVASEADVSWENIKQEARQLLRQTGNPDL